MSLEIVAELAQGFEGNSEQAKLLMKASASAGADAAKFQLVYADELATPDYQYYELFQSLEMDDGVWENLANYANELGIKLYVDIFGEKSLQLSEKIGVETIKLHGTDIANIGLLERVAQSRIPKVMLGAGGAHRVELIKAIDILSASEKEVIVLLGFQGYPTPTEMNQISRVKLISQEVVKRLPNVTVGFADHADPESPLTYALSATAIGAGARVIEKHLTLAKNMKLEDHEAALNPDEFFSFCETMRDCLKAFGESSSQEDFGMSESERGYRKMIRRHVVASKDLAVGTELSSSDLVLKRTSEEKCIHSLEFAYGKRLGRQLSENAPVLESDLVE